MSFHDHLTTREIGEIFAEEIADAGGNVANAFDDGNRLFMRAILPAEVEIKSRDRVRGGVAIRATSEEIGVHPYVFRQVCQNGAIIAHAAESHHLESADFTLQTEEGVAVALREAVRTCCSVEALSTAASEMRSMARSELDIALTMMPMLSRLRAEFAPGLLTAIVDRFFEGRDKTPFGLLNAVTSVARDTSDPEVRWRLEVIGGDFPLEIQRRYRGRPSETYDEDILSGSVERARSGESRRARQTTGAF
jgi:hypothetical protein